MCSGETSHLAKKQQVSHLHLENKKNSEVREDVSRETRARQSLQIGYMTPPSSLPPHLLSEVTFHFTFYLLGVSICSLALCLCSLGTEGRPHTLTVSYTLLNPSDSCAQHFPTRLNALRTKAAMTELNTCSIKPPDTQLPTCETAECNQVVQLTANSAISHVRVLTLSRSLFLCHTSPLSPEGLHMLQCARLNSEVGSSRNLSYVFQELEVPKEARFCHSYY